jgi:iron complex outermembrane receptor protein
VNYRIPAPVPYDFNPATHESGNYYRSSNVVLDLKQVVNDHLILQAAYQYQRRTRDNYQYSGVNVSRSLTDINLGALIHNIQNNYNQNVFASAVLKYSVGPLEAQTVASFDHYVGPFVRSVYQSSLPSPVWLVADPSTWDRSVSYFPSMTLRAGSTGQRTRQVTTNNGGTIANTFSYKKHLYLTFSARHDTINFKDTRLNTDGTQFSYSEFTNRHVSPMVGILYSFSPSISAYYDYSGSFVANLGAARALDGSNGVQKPTLGEGHEFGVKADFLDNRLSTSIAFFRNDQKDAPYTVTGIPDPLNPGGTFTATLNAGLQRTDGVEANVNAVVRKKLSFVFGYSYLDSHLLENPGNRAIEGLRSVGTPRNKLSVLARVGSFTVPLGGTVYGTVGYVYQSDMQGSSDLITTILPAFEKVSAGLNWQRQFGPRKSAVEARVSIDNALDDRYWLTTQIPGKPRSYSASLSLRY